MTAPTTAPLPAPALPVRTPITDRAPLIRLFEGLTWLDGPDVDRAALRLRWKPGTSLRIGAVVPTSTGVAAVLVAAFRPRDAAKADKLVALAARRHAPVHREGQLVAVPVDADPRVGALLPPAARTRAYNPVRRWVGRADDEAVKVHADPPPLAVGALLTRPPAGLVRYLSRAEVGRSGRVVRSAWIEGRAPTRNDLPAVWEALAALHAATPPGGLPVLDGGTALAAAARAARSVVATLPAERPRLQRLVGRLRRACATGCWPTARRLVHGDFSPDQVVVTADRAVLLDLDRAAIGPTGWDLAQWNVAQVAAGGVALAPPAPAAPVLRLATALMRAPEPFRRLRADWPARTRAVLAAADRAAEELA